MKHFPIELWCAMKSEFYTTASNNQLSGWTEKKLQSTSQSQTCTKKGHGHCSMICYKSDPLQLSESWQNHYIWESMLSKFMRCPENCNTCIRHWSTEWAQFSWQRLTAYHTTNDSKVEWIGPQSFASSAVFSSPLATWLWLLQASWQFLQGKHFHIQQ